MSPSAISERAHEHTQRAHDDRARRGAPARRAVRGGSRPHPGRGARACSRRCRSRPATPSSNAARSRTGSSSSPRARIRVHIGDLTLLENGPGGVVGEFALLAPAPRSASATAIEPSLLLRLRRGPFEELLDDRPGDRTRGDLDAGADAAGVGRQPRRDGRGVTAVEPRHESPTGPVLLLAGQGFALGLTMAWILIPASAIFLAAYGSELLPVTYIGAAVAGVVSSTLLAAAFRRRPLASVATITLAGLAVALLASWIVLATSDAEWVSFALLVLIPIVVPVGFIFVVGQAGMLLDVRVLKAFYARVVAGFALGFVAGGLAGPLLLTLLGTTESVLAAAAAATALFLVLVEVTRRRYPAQLAVVEHAEDVEAERPTLRALTRNRYVMLIVAFQMLSAVESQWLDFHVLATAAQRYDSSNALARFLSQFSAIAYGTDILFLLVFAGWLLHRFGLRYGLTANAVGVLTVVVAVIVATSLLGSGATIVFVLIVAARVTDLTFSDGTSRTSLSAAYQAVPTRMRAVAQATVEGLAVPVAIGVSGVVLLVVQAVGRYRGTDAAGAHEHRRDGVGGRGGAPLPRVPGEPAREPPRPHARPRRPRGRGGEQPDRHRPPRRERRRARRVARARHPHASPSIPSCPDEAPAPRRRRARERPHRCARTAGRGVAPRRPRTPRATRPRRSVLRRARRQHSGARRGRGPLRSRRDLRARTRRRARGEGGRRVRVEPDRRRRGPGGGRRRHRAAQPVRASCRIAPWRRSCWARSSPAAWMDRTALRALLADPDPDVVNAALGRAPMAGRRRRCSRRSSSHLDDRRTAGAAVRRAGPSRRRRARRRRRRSRATTSTVVTCRRCWCGPLARSEDRRRSRCSAGTSSTATARSGSR